MTTFPGAPQSPQRGVNNQRARELLRSARAQLGAILEGPEGAKPKSELYEEVLALMEQIEALLGY